MHRYILLVEPRETSPVKVRTLSLHLSATFTYRLPTVTGLQLLSQSHPVDTPPVCGFCSSDQSFAIRFPSDSTSRWTPLSLASGSHYQSHNRLSPSSCCPCWAHNKKKASSIKLDALPGNVLLSHTVTHAVPLTL